MTEKCPVCKNNIKENDKFCSVCGFTDLHREFITKEDGELWLKNVVLPYRKKYEESQKTVLDNGFDSNGYNKDGFDRDGSIKEVNEPQEIIDLKRRANLGDAVAQNDLGMCYKYGKGVHKDINKAIYYYEQAIENGCNVAAHNLACVYDKVTTEYPNEYEKAFKYYKLAEETGYSNGVLFNNLGRLYADGEGVETNYEMAKKYYEKAISMGSATARNNLNILLSNELERDARDVNYHLSSDFNYKSKQDRDDERTNIEPYIIWLIVCVLSIFTATLVAATLGEDGAPIAVICFIGFFVSVLGALATYKG